MKLAIISTTCVITLLISACVQEQKPVTRLTTGADIVENKEQPVLNAPVSEYEITSEQDVVPEPLLKRDLPRRVNEAYAKKNRKAEQRKVTAKPLFYQSLAEVKHAADTSYYAASVETSRDKYAQVDANPVKLVSEEPVSTFSIDVDTGSYAVVRRHINNGVLPPANAVRVEELVNYFDYQYASPADRDAPFTISTEMAQTPWNTNTRLLQIGLQGFLPEAETRSPANLVFLIDVSGSMNSRDKLPLLKNAFRLLVKKLDQQDKVTMVVYAGSSGVVLETTTGDKKADILSALDKLSAGGSTHGSAGIQLAYDMAEQARIEDGINRVILATDGDFNVGTVNHDALIDLIKKKKDQGIALSTLGFGQGNYNDHLMEQLADHGDGNYAYIDNLNEAKKVLVEQISATLETIARDVKIQIEWNPTQVSEYRLIGYENRVLNREDFNNDKVDAGDIGAGHNVTALYEITLSDSEQPRIDPLRYQTEQNVFSGQSTELAFIKLRYKKPAGKKSRLIEQALVKRSIKPSISSASNSLKFAAAVAAYGDILRGGESVQEYGYDDVMALARTGRGKDDRGYRAEFIRLVEMTELLDSRS